MILHRFNQSRDDQGDYRTSLMADLFPHAHPNLYIEPPFFCDYGANIRFGQNVYFNYDCVVLDTACVEIGDNVMFGPKVQILTATHPLDWRVREKQLEYAKPIRIGSHVWIGGGAIINPGITIGDHAVIGAGAVVTKNVPPSAVYVGNPARLLRNLNEFEDKPTL